MDILRELRKFKTRSAIAKIRILVLLAVMLVTSAYAWFFKQLNTDVKGIESTEEFGGLVPGTVLNEPVHLFDRIEVKEN